VTTSPIQKEVQAQIIKWGFWALIMLCGAGLVSLANRNVYSKTEVDERDSQVKSELRHAQDLATLQHNQVLEKLADLKRDVQELKEK